MNSNEELCHLRFLLGLFFGREDGGDMVFRNVGLTFNGLHGVVFKKPELFVTTAVGTSHTTVRSNLIRTRVADT
jgi:hypothetical protein